MRELRERIEKLDKPSYCPSTVKTVLSFIDDYERDLVARIEATKSKGTLTDYGFVANAAIDRILALIQGAAVKESQAEEHTCLGCEMDPQLRYDHQAGYHSRRETAPRDERPARDERAWLIERYINGTLYFLSLSLSQITRDGFGYTTKVDDAMRFAREADAWVALTYLAKGEGRVAEHKWLADRVVRALEGRK